MDFKNTISDFQMSYCALDNGIYDIRFHIFPKANQSLSEISEAIEGNLKNSNVDIVTQKNFGQDVILISARSDNCSKFLEFCDLKIEEKNKDSETKYIALTGPNNVEFKDGEGRKFIEAYNGDKKNSGARVEKFVTLMMDRCKNHKFVQKGSKYEIFAPENKDLSEEIKAITDKTLNISIRTEKNNGKYKVVLEIWPNDRDIGTAENRKFISQKIGEIFENKNLRIVNNGDLEISFEANSLEECEEFLNAICIRKKDGEFEYDDHSKAVDKEFLDDIRKNFNAKKEEEKVKVFANLLDFYSRKSEISPDVTSQNDENDLNNKKSNNIPNSIPSSEESNLDDNLSREESEDILNSTTKEPSSNAQNKSFSNEIDHEEKDKIDDDKNLKNKVSIEDLKQNLNFLEKFLALFIKILCKVYIEKKSAEIVEKIKNNTYQESDSKNIFDECMFNTTAKLVLDSAYQQLTSIKVK